MEIVIMNKLFISLSLLFTATAFGSEAISSTAKTPAQQKFIVTSDGARIPINGKQFEQLRSHMLAGLMFLGEMGGSELECRYESIKAPNTPTPEQTAAVWHKIGQAFDQVHFDSDESDPTGNSSVLPLREIESKTFNQLLELAGPTKHIKEVLASWDTTKCLLSYAPLYYAIEYLDIDDTIRDVIIKNMAQKLSLVHTLNDGSNRNLITFLKPYAQQNAVTHKVFTNSDIKLAIDIEPILTTLPISNACILSATHALTYTDGRRGLYHLANRTFTPFQEHMHDPVISPSGKQLAMISFDRHLYLFGIEQEPTLPIMEDVLECTFSPCETYLAITMSDKSLVLYDIEHKTTAPIMEHVYEFAFSPDEIYLAAKTDSPLSGNLHLYHIPTKTPRLIMNAIDCFSFSPASTHLAIREHHNNLHLYTLATGHIIPVRQDISAYNFSPSGSYLSIETHGTYMVYLENTRIRNRDLHLYTIATGTDKLLDSEVTAATFSPSETDIAIMSFDRQLNIYNLATGTKKTVMPNIGNFKFSSTGTHLILETVHSNLLIYNLSTGATKDLLLDNVNTFTVSPINDLVTIYTHDSHVHQIDFSAGLTYIQQLFMIYVLGCERSGTPATFTRAEIEELDTQSRMSCESSRPLLDMPAELLAHVHIVDTPIPAATSSWSCSVM